jgi:hypothetical protein
VFETTSAGLDEMVRAAEDARLYDLPLDVPVERLPVGDAISAPAARGPGTRG